jgi:hypothetical protein
MSMLLVGVDGLLLFLFLAWRCPEYPTPLSRQVDIHIRS